MYQNSPYIAYQVPKITRDMIEASSQTLQRVLGVPHVDLPATNSYEILEVHTVAARGL